MHFQSESWWWGGDTSWLMQKVRKPYVHDVVYALPQVIIQILVTGCGDAKEGGTGELVSSHSIHPDQLLVNTRSGQ